MSGEEIKEIVDMEVNRETVAIERAGFGTALLLSGTATWPERTRSYASIDDVEVDFAVGTYEQAEAAAYFRQEPKPELLIIGRLVAGARPVMRWSITVTLVANATAYKVEYNGTVYTYTSDADATEAEILAGLAAALDAADGVSSAAVVGSAVVMTLATAGAWKRLRILDTNGLEKDATKWLGLTMDAVEPGTTWASELTAIREEDDSWYWLINPWPSKALNLAIAEYIETREKVAILDTHDSAGATAAPGGSDMMQAAETAAYDHTALIWGADNGDRRAAGLTGRLAAWDPGSYTAFLKTIKGCTASVLTTTMRNNIKGKTGNYLTSIAGKAVLREGWVSSGEFIDVIHGLHWFVARVREDFVELVMNSLKVAHDDDGYARFESRLRANIEEGESMGLFSDEEDPVIIMPRSKAATTLQRQTRTMPPITGTIKLASAVHYTHLRLTVQP